jgi:hypothetical protein
MSDTAVTNPKGSGPRSVSEIESAFAQVLGGPEEQPEEDSSQEEQSPKDSADEGQQSDSDAELADDSVEDEPEDDLSDDEQPESDSTLFTVVIGGKRMEVPLDELIVGYQQNSSFTEKSQQLAQARQGFGEEQEVLRRTYQEYDNVLGQLKQQMQAAARPPNFDWDALERENPIQWLKLKELERQRVGEIQAVGAEQEKMRAIMQNEVQRKREERLVVQRALTLEGIPEWSDGDLQAEETRRIWEFGVARGFSESELDNLEDHRALLILRDAMLLQELKNGGKVTAAKSKIGSVKGGNREISRRTRSREAKAQRAKLKKTGKVDDAAVLFSKLLAE